MRRSKAELWVMHLENFPSSLGKCPCCVLLLRPTLKLPLASLSFLSCLRSVPIWLLLHSTLKIQSVLNPQSTLSLSVARIPKYQPPHWLPRFHLYPSQSITIQQPEHQGNLPTLPNLPVAPTLFTTRAKPSSILWSALFTLTSLWDALLFFFASFTLNRCFDFQSAHFTK